MRYGKQNKLIGIKVSESVYNKLKELAKKHLPKELKEKPGNKVNQYVKLMIEDHVGSFLYDDYFYNEYKKNPKSAGDLLLRYSRATQEAFRRSEKIARIKAENIENIMNKLGKIIEKQKAG